MTTSDHANPPTERRILMVVKEGSRDLDLMLRDEVVVSRASLEAAGCRVDVAVPTDRELVGSETTLVPDVSIGDVDIADYDGLYLPCMAPEPGTKAPPVVQAMIVRADELGLPIAAARGSVRDVAAADVLVGRDYSYAGAPDLEQNPEFRGATFRDTGVTRSGNLVTSGICPLAAKVLGGDDDTTKLANEFLRVLEGDHA